MIGFITRKIQVFMEKANYFLFIFVFNSIKDTEHYNMGRAKLINNSTNSNIQGKKKAYSASKGTTCSPAYS